MDIPVVFLMGPTASGKTTMALELARSLPVEIVSVDAAQVYRGMDIGTAKAGPRERALCPHHLLDIRDPDDTYSAARFREDARRLIDQIRRRGHLPLLVGGTMFYFHTLLHDLPVLPPSDSVIRAEIAAQAAAEGWPAVHRRLAALDPRRAGEISPNDSQRIQRALEVNLLTAQRVRPRTPGQVKPPWPLIRVALAPADRGRLHRRIESRFHDMLAAGLVPEVGSLLRSYGGSVEPASMRMVGYRQVADYLRGKVGYNRMMEASIAATRRLAKRQLTWLRNQSALTWIDSDHPGAGGGLHEYLDAHPLMAGVRKSDDA